MWPVNKSWQKRYMNLAKEVSSWSKDPSKKIGAVAVGSKGQVLSQGYNGFPRGINDDQNRYKDRAEKYKYVVHAEMNCIYNATYNGVSLDGSDLYIWGLPMCSECAKGAIQVGIKNIYWSLSEEIPPVWQDSYETTKKMLEEARVNIKRIDLDEE